MQNTTTLIAHESGNTPYTYPAWGIGSRAICEIWMAASGISVKLFYDQIRSTSIGLAEASSEAIWFVKQYSPNSVDSMRQYIKKKIIIKCQACRTYFVLFHVVITGLGWLLSLLHPDSIAAHDYSSYTWVRCACPKVDHIGYSFIFGYSLSNGYH